MADDKLTADSPLSNDKEQLVDESRQVVTDFGINEGLGVGRITLRPLEGHTRTEAGKVGPGKGMSEHLRERNADRAALLEEARARIIPTVHWYAPKMACTFFSRRGPNGEPIDRPAWCDGEKCPSWSNGKCTNQCMTEQPMLVRVVQPKSMAEYEKLVMEPGASAGANTAARIEAEANRLGEERASKARAERREAEARDREILELRRSRARGAVRFMPPGSDIKAEIAEAKRKASGKVVRA